MIEIKDLYHQEEQELERFMSKVNGKSLTKRDLLAFTESYRDLLAQSRVITRVSDRLQAKLNTANEKIGVQNDVIVSKNQLLQKTIGQLTHARVSKKASTILFTAAILLFVSEEIILENAIAVFINIPYLGLIVKLFIALMLKSVEGIVEKHFMKKEQAKIIEENGAGQLQNLTVMSAGAGLEKYLKS